MLFASIVLVILMLVCGSVYYFSFTNRENNLKTRLTNWAITTARLLSQSGVFDQQLMLKIDASTTLALKNKTVQAFDARNQRVYRYSDSDSDTAAFASGIIDGARAGSDKYFGFGNREAIAHFYRDKNFGLVMVAAAYDEDGLKKLQQLRFILELSFAGGILFAILAGYLFSTQLLKPLRKIADEVKNISVKSIATRIKAGKTKDEWNYLASTLNKLLDRLHESFDVHRRFIANASHELLTPLTSISSQLEVSLNRDREAAAYREVMESIYQDIRQLGRLTQTLLEFARASGDPGGLDIDLVRIDEILLSLPAEIAKLNKDYLIQLNFEQLPTDEEQLIVFGNAALLSTAIKNIVINGCKYSPNHLAKVKLSIKDQTITVTIEDEGKGIPASEFENIFQPFYRVDESSLHQGFGLGLSLAQQIIKLHKGQISIQSAVDKGTIFTITLPAKDKLLKR